MAERDVFFRIIKCHIFHMGFGSPAFHNVWTLALQVVSINLLGVTSLIINSHPQKKSNGQTFCSPPPLIYASPFFIFLLIPNIWITTAFLQRDAEGRNVKFQLDISFTFHNKSHQPMLEMLGSFTILQHISGKKNIPFDAVCLFSHLCI